MPVFSMTGYASAQHSTAHSTEQPHLPPAQLGLEIRSVNSRFLDLTFKLPEDLRQFEPALREVLSAQLKRGKVEVRASIEVQNANSVSEPSPKLLQRLNAVQDNVKAWLPMANALSVADVLRLAASEQSSHRDWSQDLTPLAETALKALLAARQREGARLGKMLLDHIAQLRTLAGKIQPLGAPTCGATTPALFRTLERSDGTCRWQCPARGRARPGADRGHRFCHSH
jgi:uncharacterized protein (TIGR00255 family)